MLSPPLRAVLWKSIGLALALIVVVAIALDRLIVWLVGTGSTSSRTALGRTRILPVDAIAWLLSVAAGFGIIVGSILLMPAVTAFVGSFFADQIADEVEREHYPADPPGVALPLWRAVLEGGKTALLAVAGLYLRRAVPVVCRIRRRDLFSRHRLAARPRILRVCRHAFPAACRGEGVAQALCRRRSMSAAC